MKRLPPAALAALILLMGAGCHYLPSFKKTPNVPKENRAVSASVEKEFEQRWVDKRAADLVAGGKAADAAHAQAQEEFRQKFSFTLPAQKP